MLVVRVVLTWSPSSALSLSATSYSLTFAAFGRAFPHDVETTASLRRWILFFRLLLSALSAAQPGRHFSPNPRSQPFQFAETSHRPELARSLKPSSLPACLERGSGSERRSNWNQRQLLRRRHPHNTTPPQFYHTLLLPCCLLSPFLYYCTAHPHYSHALASSTRRFFDCFSPSPLTRPVMPAMSLDEDKRRDSRRDDAQIG
jgi:hypothetical protein